MATSTKTGYGDDISHRVHDRRYLTTSDAGEEVIGIWESLLDNTSMAD